MKPLLLFLGMIVICQVSAQERKIFVVNPGQRITDVLTKSDIYRYPEFGSGTVYFKNGNETPALMNYSLLFGEFQFIDQKGDTLSLADEDMIRLITINNDSFYYDKGVFELLDSAKDVALLGRQILRQTGASKIGLYNQTVDGGAASSYNRLSSGTHSVDLVVNEKITFEKEALYFFKSNNRMLPATKKNLEKMFPGQKTAINDYFSKNQVDFKNENDMRNLFHFLSAR